MSALNAMGTQQGRQAEPQQGKERALVCAAGEW